eukprot:gene918-228_t
MKFVVKVFLLCAGTSASYYADKGPPWMECEGVGFNPLWKEFKDKLGRTPLQRHINQNGQQDDWIHFIRVIDQELIVLAYELFEKYFQSSLEFGRHIESFHWGDLAAIDKRRGQSDYLSFMAAVGLGKSSPGQGEDWVCPLGFANVAYVRALHLHLDLSIPQNLNLSAEHYHMVHSVFGWNAELDFLSSSSWPIMFKEIRYAYQSLVHLSTGFKNVPDLKKFGTDFCSPWQPADTYLPAVSSHESKALKIGALGHHVPLTLEPVMMFLASHNSVVDPVVNFRGVYYACYVSPELCKSQESNPITQVLRKWTTTIDTKSESSEFDSLMTEMIELLLQDQEFMSSDLFVCTALFAPCTALFIAVLSSGTMGGRKESLLFFYQSTELLLSVPEDRKSNVLEDMEQFLASDRTAFIYNSCLWSARTLYMTDKRLPVVPSISWYVHFNGFVEYKPSNRILIFRSPVLEKSAHGNAFWNALAHFHQGTFPYVFEPLACPLVTEQVGSCECKGRLTYQQMAEYGAVILFPHDFTLMSFGDLYAMHVPILIPSKEWTVQNLGAIFMKHGSLCIDTEFSSQDAERIQGWFPFGSHWDQNSEPDAHDVALSKLSYWYEYSEFARTPHVLTFSSIPDLMAQLLAKGTGLDTSWISTRMKWYHDQQTVSALSTYSEMLTKLGRPTHRFSADRVDNEFIEEKRSIALAWLHGHMVLSRSHCASEEYKFDK